MQLGWALLDPGEGMTSPQDPWQNQNPDSSDDDAELKPQRPQPPGPYPQEPGPGPQRPRYPQQAEHGVQNQNPYPQQPGHGANQQPGPYQQQQGHGTQQPNPNPQQKEQGAQQRPGPYPQQQGHGSHQQQNPYPQQQGHGAHQQQNPYPQQQGYGAHQQPNPYAQQQGHGAQQPNPYAQQPGPGPQQRPPYPQQYEQHQIYPHQSGAASAQPQQGQPFVQNDQQASDSQVPHQDYSQMTHNAEAAYASQSPMGPAAAYADQLLSMWVDWNNKALVVKAIMVVNVVLFVLMVIASGGKELMNPTTEFLIQWGANAGAYTLDADYWRIVTAAFLHGSFLHIAMNMAVLWDVGPLVERIYGSKRFLLLYFFAAITASLNTLFWNPGGCSVGASGAVFGIFGAMLAFYQSHRKSIPAHVIKEKSRVVMAVIGYNLIFGVMQPNIDNAGHVGGLIGGFLIGLVLSPREPQQRRIRFLEVLGVAVCTALCFGLWTVDKTVPMDKNGTFAIMSALRMHAKGRAEESLNFLNRYIDDLHGAEPDVRLMRAELLINEKSKLDEAMQDVDVVLKANPNSAHGNQMKAYILLRQNKATEAIEYTQRGLQNPGNSGVGLLLIQAEALTKLGRFPETIDTLTSIIKADPKYGAAYAMRAICYRQLQQNDLAKADFEKALELGAGSSEVYRGLGLLNFLTGNYQEAISYYRRDIDAGNDKSSQWPFSFILKYFAELKSGNEAQAQDTMIGAAKLLDGAQWPAPIVDYLLNKMSATALENKAKDIGQLAEAKTYIGMSFWAKGKQGVANSYFRWVLANAPKGFIEYELARKLITTSSAN